VRNLETVRQQTAADPHVLEAGHAPTAFLADEIRMGSPVGRTIRLLVEVDDSEPFIRVQRYVWTNERSATTERWQETVNGARVGEIEERDISWRQLQARSSFPAEQTSIEADTIETPLGIMDCLRYTVREGETVKRLWFARHLPGVPVKVVVKEQGRLISTVTMVANEFA
jgi:hypothetical protein